MSERTATGRIEVHSEGARGNRLSPNLRGSRKACPKGDLRIEDDLAADPQQRDTRASAGGVCRRDTTAEGHEKTRASYRTRSRPVIRSRLCLPFGRLRSPHKARRETRAGAKDSQVVYGDFERIVREVTDLRQRTGQDVLYLGIMPEDMPKVEQEDSKRFMKLVEDVLPMCSMLCVSMEMRGFRAAIIRSAMAAVTLLTRRHDKLRSSIPRRPRSTLANTFIWRTVVPMARAIEQTGSIVPPGFGP
jgi:hypothetical protein